MSRRDQLRVLGVASVGVLTGCLPTGAANDSGPAQARALTTKPSAAQVAAPSRPDCVISPRQTAGPFYFDAGLVRRDITEGRPGTPLVVAFRLVHADSCRPIPDAVVDIWHADAVGQYSGYRGQGDNGSDTSGETFLRGIQVTDAEGLAEFDTIYPGAYSGRTVHIHFKAYTDERSFITSQLYFPDEATDAVFTGEPYASRGPRRTTNANDGIFSADLLARVTSDAGGHTASLTVGVGT